MLLDFLNDYFIFQRYFFSLTDSRTVLNWWRRKAKKSGFISDIKRKSLTNPPTIKSRFKLVRLGWGTGILNPALAMRGRQAAPTKRKWETRLQLAPIFSPPYRKPKEKVARCATFSFGWGTGIRTPEMSESESDALPLGDTPIFRTRSIIAERNRFVKGFFKKSYLFFCPCVIV